MATLFDDPAVLVDWLAFAEEPVTPTSTVFAPCCGRRTSADAVVDVRAVPNTVVSPGRRGVGEDQDWLCDACRTRMTREGRQKRIRAIRRGHTIPNNVWTDSKLARAIGEPWEVVRRLRAKEIVRERELTESIGDPLQAYRNEWAALPETNIPGTEPPT